MPAKVKITVGMRQGKLVITRQCAERDAHRNILWECLCDCGHTTILTTNALSSRGTQSCGCLSHAGTHGMTGTPEYRAWNDMKQRCYNPNDAEYVRYGARGRTICDEWRNDFMAFYNHVGKRPSSAHSIERMNNNKGYEPGNVRWAVLSEQAVNKTNSHHLTFNGRTLTVSQWARVLGCSDSSLRHRVRFWASVEQILTTPFRVKPR